jgi:hypothetical protein
MLMRQQCAFAECWHVGPQVVDPDFLGIPRVSCTGSSAPNRGVVTL